MIFNKYKPATILILMTATIYIGGYLLVRNNINDTIDQLDSIKSLNTEDRDAKDTGSYKSLGDIMGFIMKDNSVEVISIENGDVEEEITISMNGDNSVLDKFIDNLMKYDDDIVVKNILEDRGTFLMTLAYHKSNN